MHPPILTLLTDFGLQDPYVGSMKGVILKIVPWAQVIDLTHQIPPQDIAAARYGLMSAYGDFPEGTVHVAVVDPGVGGPRRGVAIQIPEGYLVGPDNGLFSGVLHRSSPQVAVELTQAKWWRTPDPSSTFHGRDIFAPVAAHLAHGLPIDQLGDLIPLESLVQLPILPVQTTDTGLQGSIQYIDHFGNLITTIPAERVQGRTWQIRIQTTVIPSGQTFGTVAAGDLLGLIGSQGWLEIAVNRGDARDRLGLSVGDPVLLEFIERRQA